MQHEHNTHVPAGAPTTTQAATPAHVDHDHAQHAAGAKHAAPMKTAAMDHSAHQHGAAVADDHSAHGGMHAGHADLMRQRFWIALVLTIPVLLYSDMIQMWLGFSAPVFPGSQLIAPVFSTIIFLLGGLLFIGMARGELRMRQPGMMTLISLAVVSSYGYSMAVYLFGNGDQGFFWELATLIDVMLLGHWIELRSVGQAQGALRELAKLLPDTAERLLSSGETETVALASLSLGDRLLVRPGASIPADGKVVQGESDVNESMITGESRPVKKGVGDTVIAGTVNSAGSLRVEVSGVGESTALAGIMRLVADAQNSRSRAQTLAQRAAFYLTIIAIIAGVVTLLAWWIGTGDVPLAVQSMVTVLVIACPHALGLAVPLVVAISTTLSARNGLLVRDRLALESARELDVIVFDKTGTLTTGQQGVVDVATVELAADDALKIAAAVEGDSEHMIARAIRQQAKAKGLALPAVSGFNSLPGRGVQASIDGARYSVGGPRLLEQAGWTLPAALETAKQKAESAGQSVVYLANEGGVMALFVISDVVRPESKPAVDALHALGLQVAMLTGDSNAVAQAVAAQLGIDTTFAEVLPEHKADKIRELQRGGRKVAMVGDGVNDAPALAVADVGIAIGAGTDVAVESAGIVLVRSDPRDIVKIVRLSRATYRKMIENLIWAAGYNVVAIPLAMGILAPWGILLAPAVGAALMSVSTVVVAVNAQLLRRVDLQGV